MQEVLLAIAETKEGILGESVFSYTIMTPIFSVCSPQHG